jgi:hypothetical protein
MQRTSVEQIATVHEISRDRCGPCARRAEVRSDLRCRWSPNRGSVMTSAAGFGGAPIHKLLSALSAASNQAARGADLASRSGSHCADVLRRAAAEATKPRINSCCLRARATASRVVAHPNCAAQGREAALQVPQRTPQTSGLNTATIQTFQSGLSALSPSPLS